jgi:plasmid rolling circle replication initiator protein Rep
MCIWRKSLFVFAQFLLIAHKLLELYPGTIFLFHTLTLRNCPIDELSDTLTHLNKSFRRYLAYKRVKTVFKGTFRSLETTYNSEMNTFHPHIHSIVAVNKHYFASRDYITHEDLQQLWKKALQVDYDPDCDIRRIKPRKKNVSTVNEEIQLMDRALMEDALVAGGAEVAKYSTKVGDIVDPKIKPDDSPEKVRAKIALREDQNKQAEVLEHLMRGLSNRRLICYTGIFKEAYKALKCADVEDSDLILMPGEEPVCTCRICNSELVQLHYVWNGKGYFERPQEGKTHTMRKVA